MMPWTGRTICSVYTLEKINFQEETFVPKIMLTPAEIYVSANILIPVNCNDPGPEHREPDTEPRGDQDFRENHEDPREIIDGYSMQRRSKKPCYSESPRQLDEESQYEPSLAPDEPQTIGRGEVPERDEGSDDGLPDPCGIPGQSHGRQAQEGS